MKKKFGGEDFCFEIVVESNDLKLLPTIIKIRNKVVGTLDDVTYFPSFVAVLTGILDSNHYFDEYVDIKNYQSYFIENDKDIDNVSFGDTFDDFSIKIMKNKE